MTNKLNSNPYQQALKELRIALQRADWDAFHKARFTLAEEGWYFQIRNLDLRGLNLPHLPGKFLAFKRCNFRGASLAQANFLPASFKDCDMRGVDLSGAHGVCYMLGCDLRGAKYDESTILFDRARSDAPSELQNCKVDDGFRKFLVRQGVRFKLMGNHAQTEF